MRICIIGSSGFVGKHIFMKLLQKHRIFGVSRNKSIWTNITADISNRNQIFDALDTIDPDVVIHTAAYSNVEGCESNKDLANRINISGTGNVVEWCKNNNRKLVFISSDYVYSDDDTKKTELSETNPPNYYGYTKLMGEKKQCH